MCKFGIKNEIDLKDCPDLIKFKEEACPNGKKINFNFKEKQKVLKLLENNSLSYKKDKI